MSPVHDARSDYWLAEATARECDTAEIEGASLVRHLNAEGPWNCALVHTAAVDPDACRDWFGGEPWASAVPSALPWSAGRLLKNQPLMSVPVGEIRAAEPAAGVTIRTAVPEDLDLVVALDVAAFGGPANPDWNAVHLRGGPCHAAVAFLDGEPAGTAYTVRSDGRAGPAVLLGGVGVVPAARRRGVGAALSTWLLTRPGAEGLAHLSPETPDAARIYRRLGFRPGGAVALYVGN